jgi:glycosyltransferase involved in cell wall biosynthesis
MNVLHINTSDTSGGAAIAARRLHDAMRQSGINSKYFVLNRTIRDREDIVTVKSFEKNVKRLINLAFEILQYKMCGFSGLFSSFSFGIDISKRSEVIDSDVIYIHWICTSFISYRTLRKILKTGKPVFWFMHDMFPITGGCHYSLECINYQDKCQHCPYHIKRRGLVDLSVRQFRIKKKLYQQFDNLFFIVPSKWLYDCAQESNLTKTKQIYHIPNLIDGTLFKVIDKNAARKMFSLKINKKIIGFGADSVLKNPVKGWQYLKMALDILWQDNSQQKEEIIILVWGSSYNKDIADSIPFASYFLGHLYDEYSISMVYNCLDVFVISSIAENFPNTILESLSCNTPVVGFDIGGIPDTVNANTGYLAKYKDSKDLAAGIAYILKNGKADISSSVKPFLPDTIVEKHKALWKQRLI